MHHGRGEAEQGAAGRAAPGYQLQRQVGADHLQAGAVGEVAQLGGALPAVGEVAGDAVRADQGVHGLAVAVLVDDAGLHQRGPDQVRPAGQPGRAEAGPGPGQRVAGEGEPLGRRVHRHRREDLDARVPLAGGEPAPGGGGDRGEQQFARAPAAAAPVPADQALTPGQLGEELHGGRPVVHHDQVAGAAEGEQQLHVAGERVADDDPGRRPQPGREAPDGGQRCGRPAPGLLPADLDALAPGQLGHAAELAPGHRVEGGEDDQGEAVGGLPGGVGPLQHVEELDGALHEGQRLVLALGAPGGPAVGGVRRGVLGPRAPGAAVRRRRAHGRPRPGPRRRRRGRGGASSSGPAPTRRPA